MSAKPAPRLWTEAEIETLRAGWRTGLTCREIAAKLPGRGKSAVGGMAHRLGLTLRAPEKANGLALCAPRRVKAARTATVRDYVPAPISLAGPAWSHPSNARAA
jgi:hypothetical protein